MLMELNLDDMLLIVTKGLTEETAWGRISSTSLVLPLFVHLMNITSQASETF